MYNLEEYLDVNHGEVLKQEASSNFAGIQVDVQSAHRPGYEELSDQ